MYRALILLGAVICLAAMVGCQKNSNDKAYRQGAAIQVEVPLSDMVTFDRAYIPTLALTDSDDAEKAKKAMKVLIARWEVMHAKYSSMKGISPQWHADFDDIDRMIHTAESWLLEGKPPREAHGVLEGVRTVLKNLRLGYGVFYELDILTLYHEPMEAITLAVKDKTAEQLTTDDVAVIGEQYRYAESIWGQAVKAQFDPALFELTPEQETQLRLEIANETSMMDELKSALAANDTTRILAAASALKPHFTAIYTLFGDFSAVH